MQQRGRETDREYIRHGIYPRHTQTDTIYNEGRRRTECNTVHCRRTLNINDLS